MATLRDWVPTQRFSQAFAQLPTWLPCAAKSKRCWFTPLLWDAAVHDLQSFISLQKHTPQWHLLWGCCAEGPQQRVDLTANPASASPSSFVRCGQRAYQLNFTCHDDNGMVLIWNIVGSMNMEKAYAFPHELGGSSRAFCSLHLTEVATYMGGCYVAPGGNRLLYLVRQASRL